MDNAELGRRLKAARLAKKMTQSEVVGDFITRNMLSQIESGTATPMATCSANCFASVLGEISPKSRMTSVITTVDSVGPRSPTHPVKSTVAMAVPAMLTRLLPTRMLVSSLS